MNHSMFIRKDLICIDIHGMSRYEFIFEALHLESMLMRTELQFNRHSWNEHMIAWSLFQFDVHGYRPTGQFFVLADSLIHANHGLLKDCKNSFWSPLCALYSLGY